MKLTLFLALLVSGHLLAKPLLVSDVDDTIKVSYVLEKHSVTANAFMMKNVFMGMPDLYQRIQSNTKSDVKYLSNAPTKFVGRLHRKFLRKNKFPKGDLVTRSFYEIRKGSEHKVNSLRKFITDNNPESMILIGDNGEKDTEVYHQIATEFPEVEMHTFIRQAYSSVGHSENFAKPLEENQRPFVSSIEIAAELYQLGILTQEDLTEHILLTAPDIIKEDHERERGRPMAFPEWYDCRDFKIESVPLLVDQQAQEFIQAYVEKVNYRCLREPFDD